MTSSFDPGELILRFAKDNPAVPALQFISADPQGFTIQDVGETGVVNYVFKVLSRSKEQSIIIKYAEERMKAVPTEEVSLDRQTLEYDCLQMLQTVLPGSVPEVYCLDKTNNAIAMQDMSEWELLGAQLKRCHVDLEAAAFLGEQLATINVKTSRVALTSDRWQDLVSRFSQDNVRGQLVSIFYQRPIIENDEVNVIPTECLDKYRSYVQEIKERGFVEKVTKHFDQRECFIHADCHCFSIFVKDGKTVLFDFEYAFLGPEAANLALPLISYLMYFLLKKVHSESPGGQTVQEIKDLQTVFAQGARTLVAAYLKAHTAISSNEKRLEMFLSDSALMTGANMFFMGTSFCLSAVCEALPCERAAFMEAGLHIMRRHEDVKNIDALIDVMFHNYD